MYPAVAQKNPVQMDAWKTNTTVNRAATSDSPKMTTRVDEFPPLPGKLPGTSRLIPAAHATNMTPTITTLPASLSRTGRLEEKSSTASRICAHVSEARMSSVAFQGIRCCLPGSR